MNLYLLSQDVNNNYDTYDRCVVAAETEELAKLVHPRNRRPSYLEPGKPWNPWESCQDEWASTPDQVTVKLIGRAVEGTKEGVVLASYNAS